MKRSDISGTDALSWMQVLNYSRPAGTAAEKQAAEQIAASIRPFADFVSVESFAWRPRKGDGNNGVLPSQNVCAFLAGTKDTPEYLVLSAHYDSVPEGPGAYDNLSSCAVMAELLRYFSCHRPKRSLTFVFLGAEELGLLGSRAYVERHQNELKNCRFNLNSDLAGQEGGIDVLGVTAGDEAVDALRDICKEHGLSCEYKRQVWSSDSNSFAMAGIPALTYDRDGYGMHTKEDTLDRISPIALEDACTLIGTIAEDLSCRDFFPIPRTIPKTLQEELHRYFAARNQYDLHVTSERNERS